MDLQTNGVGDEVRLIFKYLKKISALIKRKYGALTVHLSAIFLSIFSIASVFSAFSFGYTYRVGRMAPSIANDFTTSTNLLRISTEIFLPSIAATLLFGGTKILTTSISQQRLPTHRLIVNLKRKFSSNKALRINLTIAVWLMSYYLIFRPPIIYWLMFIATSIVSSFFVYMCVYALNFRFQFCKLRSPQFYKIYIQKGVSLWRVVGANAAWIYSSILITAMFFGVMSFEISRKNCTTIELSGGLKYRAAKVMSRDESGLYIGCESAMDIRTIPNQSIVYISAQ